MGFLSGTTTFSRYRISNDHTGAFGEEHLQNLTDRAFKLDLSQLIESAQIGFTAGTHLFDTQFELEKNIIGDALHFSIRTDCLSVPGPIKNAWMKIELAGIMGDHKTGRPSKSQNEEAKEAVEARCQAEAANGKFIRSSETAALWDAATDTLFLSSNSEKGNDSCLDLIQQAFGLEFEPLTPSKLAMEWADESKQLKSLYESQPTPWHPQRSDSQIVWWNGMGDNYDYLGNEFLLWLWYRWETAGDTIQLSDDSEVTGMFSRSLTLDCPWGEHGKESITAECPVALPEAEIAIRMGKLPRKAGLTLIRNNEQYDFSLQAESFGVSGGKISLPGIETGQSRELTDRIESIRQFADSIDFLFETFCQVRIGSSWKAESKQITQWLQSEKQTRVRPAA